MPLVMIKARTAAKLDLRIFSDNSLKSNSESSDSMESS